MCILERVRDVVDRVFEKPAQDLEGSTKDWLDQNSWAESFMQFRSFLAISDIKSVCLSHISEQGGCEAAGSWGLFMKFMTAVPTTPVVCRNT